MKNIAFIERVFSCKQVTGRCNFQMGGLCRAALKMEVKFKLEKMDGKLKDINRNVQEVLSIDSPAFRGAGGTMSAHCDLSTISASTQKTLNLADWKLEKYTAVRKQRIEAHFKNIKSSSEAELILFYGDGSGKYAIESAFFISNF